MTTPTTTPVTLGLEVALEEPPAVMRDVRLGVLVNQGSVDAAFRYAHRSIADAGIGRVTAVFGPQHGLWSEQQDNMIETAHATEPRLGVPVFSLYADTREPTDAMLDEIDVMVVDLQDVGTRVYTYVWTLLLVMNACGRRDIPVVVLDRPNPLGGDVVEGPVLDLAFSSFVGLAPVPMRHALTIGEMATWLQERFRCDLHVVPMRGWRRSMLWPDTGRAWVPPSPNLPRFEGVCVYPGQVLIEGTNLSEGRGCTTPFEVCGAPWIDPDELADAMAAVDTPGLAFRPYRFEPTFQKHAGSSCGGLFWHVTDAAAVRSYRTTLSMLAAIQERHPEFAWREPPYEYEIEKAPIDILTGGSAVRCTLSPGTVVDLARVDVDDWRQRSDFARLYPDDD